MWRQKHFSIFKLLKSSFLDQIYIVELFDVINYILIHVNSFKKADDGFLLNWTHFSSEIVYIIKL